jgi:UDP-2,3-diacylglucosamine hydrolase
VHARTLVASDFHLGIPDHPMVRDVHAWLDYAADRTRHLIINGDLFDFWFEYRHAIPRKHTRILGHLAALVDSGTRIDFIGGNHDWWAGSFLSDEVGLHLHHHPVKMSLGGQEAWIGHGDGLGRGDLGYRALRRILRSRITQWGFRWLHPDLGARIAGRVSRTMPGARQSEGSPPHPRVRALETWARGKLEQDLDLDLVILGHTHVPQRIEVGPGRFYLNAGDWLHHGTWLEIEADSPPQLLRWAGGPEIFPSEVLSAPLP